VTADFPQAWNIDFSSECSKDGEAGEEDSDTDDDGANEGRTSPNPQLPPPVELQRKSLAYQEFLQFLELGCSGSPRDGYPTVVIILSTIPSEVCFMYFS
jgi:E3 ubiquitin-protein ligase listerin